jgi:hypothetical protein
MRVRVLARHATSFKMFRTFALLSDVLFNHAAGAGRDGGGEPQAAGRVGDQDRGVHGRGLHSSTSRLNLSRV